MAGTDPDGTKVATGKTLGSLTFSMTVDERKWKARVRRFHRQLSQVIEKFKRTHHYLDCQRWWDRGEEFPEYEANAHEPEWWQEGNEPPGFCAA